MNCLESNKILTNMQHDFMRAFSTLTPLAAFLRDIRDSLDTGA